MAGETFSLVKVFLGSYELTSVSNMLSLNHNCQMNDDTVFGATGMSNKPGLPNADFTLGGLMELGTGSSEQIIADNIADDDTIISVMPYNSGVIGTVGYSFKSVEGEYKSSGKIGALHAFTMAAYSRGLILRGTVMENSAKTTTTNGTGRQLGAVASGQKLYAAMHITAVSGTNPTLAVVVQSDDNSGFTSAVQRVAFTQATGVTSEWISYSYELANTDDYWRASWTIGGTNSPSFTTAIIFGIK